MYEALEGVRIESVLESHRTRAFESAFELCDTSQSETGNSRLEIRVSRTKRELRAPYVVTSGGHGLVRAALDPPRLGPLFAAPPRPVTTAPRASLSLSLRPTKATTIIIIIIIIIIISIDL